MNATQPNGTTCPKCGQELWDSNPDYVLTSAPPQKRVHCPACGYRGTDWCEPQHPSESAQCLSRAALLAQISAHLASLTPEQRVEFFYEIPYCPRGGDEFNDGAGKTRPCQRGNDEQHAPFQEPKGRIVTDNPKCRAVVKTKCGATREFAADNMLDALAQEQVWRYRHTSDQSNLILYENGNEIKDSITIMTGLMMLTPAHLMRAGATREEALWILGLGPRPAANS